MTESGDGRAKLIVDNATKFYDTKSGPLHALDGFTMSVADGEFVCVVGPSGCGKTTLLWSIAGLHGLTDGRVRLDGRTISTVRTLAERGAFWPRCERRRFVGFSSAAPARLTAFHPRYR